MSLKLTPADPVLALKRVAAQYPTQVEAAAALGRSPSYLCDLLQGTRECSDRVLALVGLRRVVVKA